MTDVSQEVIICHPAGAVLSLKHRAKGPLCFAIFKGNIYSTRVTILISVPGEVWALLKTQVYAVWANKSQWILASNNFLTCDT